MVCIPARQHLLQQVTQTRQDVTAQIINAPAFSTQAITCLLGAQDHTWLAGTTSLAVSHKEEGGCSYEKSTDNRADDNACNVAST